MTFKVEFSLEEWILALDILFCYFHNHRKITYLTINAVKVQLFQEGQKMLSLWFWNLLGKRQNHEDDCANFCGLLRKAEL